MCYRTKEYIEVTTLCDFVTEYREGKVEVELPLPDKIRKLLSGNCKGISCTDCLLRDSKYPVCILDCDDCSESMCNHNFTDCSKIINKTKELLDEKYTPEELMEILL